MTKFEQDFYVKLGPAHILDEGAMTYNKPPTRYCFFCGTEIGAYYDYDPLDTCGDRKCEREARAVERDRKEEKDRGRC